MKTFLTHMTTKNIAHRRVWNHMDRCSDNGNDNGCMAGSVSSMYV